MTLPPAALEILKVVLVLVCIALLDAVDALIHALKVRR